MNTKIVDALIREVAALEDSLAWQRDIMRQGHIPATEFTLMQAHVTKTIELKNAIYTRLGHYKANE